MDQQAAPPGPLDVNGPPVSTVGPTLLTGDGIELATRCWLSGTGRDAIVVISHGFTANKDDAKVVMLAERLYALGYEVVTYDSRGHGRSGGRCTLGKLEGHDVAAVVEWARTRSTQVVLVSASMGAVGALAYAAGDPALTGVVTVSSPGEWRLPLRARSLLTAVLARTNPGRRWAERKMNVRIAPWASPDSPSRLLSTVHCPVVVIHGARDPIIPMRAGLADRFVQGPRRELVLIPDMGHAFDPAGTERIGDAVARLVMLGRARASP